MYGGLKFVAAPISYIWRSPLVNDNTSGNQKVFGIDNSYLYISSSGFVVWEPDQNLRFCCSIDTTYSPFDSQRCVMTVEPSGLQKDELKFFTNSLVDLSSYSSNSEWDLPGTSIVVDNSDGAKMDVVLSFKRRPSFMIITLIMPVMFLAALNIFVFILPQVSGERKGFAITMLLSMVVFMTIAQSLLPATALPRLSSICILLMVDVTMSGMISIFVMISSRIFYTPQEIEIPGWIKRIQTFSVRQILHRKPSKIDTSENKCEDMCIDKKKTDMDAELTWGDVSVMWDKFSFIFFMCWFSMGVFAYVLDLVANR